MTTLPQLTDENWRDVLAEADRQSQKGIENWNQVLLHGLSINTNSFNGMDVTADDAIDIRTSYKERCEAWQETIRSPTQSEAAFTTEDTGSSSKAADDSDRETLAPGDSFSVASSTTQRSLQDGRQAQWGRGKLVEAQWTEESTGTGGDVASGAGGEGSGYETDIGAVDDGVDEEEDQLDPSQDHEDGGPGEMMEAGASESGAGQQSFAPVISGKWHEHF